MDRQETIELLKTFKQTAPRANKADVEAEFLVRCRPQKERSVFVGEGFAIRFSEANSPSFSNVVLSLSALQKYDLMPVVICIVRPDRLDFRLANSTFLRRISHSSHTLRTDNIRGSFLGHDIVDQYEEIPNRPEYFDDLFAIHSEFTWEDNVIRLVEATNAIVARSTRFSALEELIIPLMEAPARAAIAMTSARFQEVERELSAIVELRRVELLAAVALNNVNLRGNAIEQIITGAGNAHRLDDLAFELELGGTLIVDIKTKLLDRASAPKAYNIDKMLTLLATPGSVFAIFFVGLDSIHGAVHSRLVSVFDPVILNATRIQTHWAGRASRGVTQFTGDLSRLFSRDYQPTVDVQGGIALLRNFLER